MLVALALARSEVVIRKRASTWGVGMRTSCTKGAKCEGAKTNFKIKIRNSPTSSYSYLVLFAMYI